MLAQKVALFRSLAAQDLKPVPGDNRGNRAAAETDLRVRLKHRIRHDGRLVVIRIDGFGREMAGEDRSIRWERRGDNFINANPCAGQASIEATNPRRVIGIVWRIENSTLLHGPAILSPTDYFLGVGHATAKFLFDTRAAAGQRSDGEQT